MSMFVRAALVVVVCLNVHAMVRSADPEKPKLDGQHHITSGERNGQPVAAEFLKGCTFRFAGNKLTGALGARLGSGQSFDDGGGVDRLLPVRRGVLRVVFGQAQGFAQGQAQREVDHQVETQHPNNRVFY